MKTIVSLSLIAAIVGSNMISAQNELACAVSVKKNIMHAEESKKADTMTCSSAAYYQVRLNELNRMRMAIDSQIIDFFEKEKSDGAQSQPGDELTRKRIEGSEFCGVLWNQLFEHNKETIKLLLHTRNDMNILMDESLTNMMREATRFILSSREIRREARNEQQAAARLAGLVNAEEKEYAAIKLQEKILLQLSKQADCKLALKF